MEEVEERRTKKGVQHNGTAINLRPMNDQRTGEPRIQGSSTIFGHILSSGARPRTDFGEQLLLRSLSEIRRDYNFSPIPVQKMARFVSRGEDLQPAFGVVRVPLRSCSLSQTVAIRSISEGNNPAVSNEKRAQNTEKRKINSDDEQSKCNGVENKYFLK